MSDVIVWLPIEPLAEAIERAASRRVDRFGICRNLTHCRVFGCPADSHSRLHRRYLATRATGRVPLDLAEDICDEVLGLHARMLYGDAWDDAAEEAARIADAREQDGPCGWVEQILAKLRAHEQALAAGRRDGAA